MFLPKKLKNLKKKVDNTDIILMLVKNKKKIPNQEKN